MRPLPVIQVLAAAALWASAGTAAALAAPHLPATVLAEARAALGGLALIGVIGARTAIERLRVSRGRDVVQAAIAMGLFQWAFFASIETLPASLAVLLASATSPFVADALLFRRGELARTARWGLLACGLIASLVIPLASARASVPGVVLSLLSGAAYAFYADAAARLVRTSGSSAGAGIATAFALLGAAVALAPATAAASPQAFTTSQVVVIAYLGLAATGLAYVLFLRGLATMSPNSAMSLVLVQPVAAAVFECLLGVRPPLLFVADLALAVGVVALRSWALRPNHSQPAPAAPASGCTSLSHPGGSHVSS